MGNSNDENLDPIDDSGELTVGAEIEFLVLATKYKPIDVLDQIREHIEACIKARGITAGAKVVVPMPGQHQWGCWTVKEENIEKKPADERNKKWYGVEICSPVMNFATFRTAIPVVLSAIKELDVPKMVTDQCAFQVHIGRGNKGFTPLTLKKLATIIAFSEEDMLNKLCHPARLESEFAVSINQSILAEKAGSDGQKTTSQDLGNKRSVEYRNWLKDLKPDNLLITLWDSKVSSVKNVVELLTPNQPLLPYAAAVSFFNLIDSRQEFGSDRPIKRTIEFRRFQGTLDPVAALAAFELCMALVEFARKSDPEKFSNLIKNLRPSIEEQNKLADQKQKAAENPGRLDETPSSPTDKNPYRREDFLKDIEYHDEDGTYVKCLVDQADNPSLG